MSDYFDTTSMSLGLTDPSTIDFQAGTGMDYGSNYNGYTAAVGDAPFSQPSIYNDASTIGTGSSGSWYSSLASGLNATNDVLKPLVGIAGSGVGIYKAISGGGGGGGGTVILPGKTSVIKTGGGTAGAAAKNNLILYVILGAVGLVLVAALFLAGRSKGR